MRTKYNLIHPNLSRISNLTVNIGRCLVVPFFRRLADGRSPVGSIRRCISRYYKEIHCVFISDRMQQTLIHGCCNNSAAVILRLGSRSSIAVTASRQSSVTLGNRLKSIALFTTLERISSSLSLKRLNNRRILHHERVYPSNGAIPLSSVNAMTPTDHISFSIR